MTTHYIIRHKPTGRTLPARILATHYEFDRPEGTHEPRLFKSERAAKNCATCWAQGAWEQVRGRDGDWETGYYDTLETPAPNAIPGRRREDLEVVAMQLVPA